MAVAAVVLSVLNPYALGIGRIKASRALIGVFLVANFLPQESLVYPLYFMLTFFFIWTWNEFFLPLIFLISNQNQTVPVALANLQGQHIMDPATTSAAALLGILPAILFFIIFQCTLTPAWRWEH